LDTAKSEQDKKATAKSDDPLSDVKRDNTPMPNYYKAWDKFATTVDDDEEVNAKIGKI